MKDTTDLTKEIGEKAAELNTLLARLPRTCKAEIAIIDSQPIDQQFPTPMVNVSVFQWLGGNRRG